MGAPQLLVRWTCSWTVSLGCALPSLALNGYLLPLRALIFNTVEQPLKTQQLKLMRRKEFEGLIFILALRTQLPKPTKPQNQKQTQLIPRLKQQQRLHTLGVLCPPSSRCRCYIHIAVILLKLRSGLGRQKLNNICKSHHFLSAKRETSQ